MTLVCFRKSRIGGRDSFSRLTHSAKVFRLWRPAPLAPPAPAPGSVALRGEGVLGGLGTHRFDDFTNMRERIGTPLTASCDGAAFGVGGETWAELDALAARYRPRQNLFFFTFVPQRATTA